MLSYITYSILMCQRNNIAYLVKAQKERHKKGKAEETTVKK